MRCPSCSRTFLASAVGLPRERSALVVLLVLTTMASFVRAQSTPAQNERPRPVVVLPPDEAPRACDVSLDVRLYEGPEPTMNRSCLQEWGAIVLARQVARQQEANCLRNTPDQTAACIAGCSFSGRRRVARRVAIVCEDRCRSNSPRVHCRELARARFLEVLRWRLEDLRTQSARRPHDTSQRSRSRASWAVTAAQRDVLRGDFDRADRSRAYLAFRSADPAADTAVSDLLRSRGLIFQAQANAVGRSFDGGVR